MKSLMFNFRDIARAQLLKYAAGQKIFCPVCGDVLDWHTTVSFTGENKEGVTKDATLCLKCYSNPEFQAGLKSLRKKGFRFYKFYRLRIRNMSNSYF